MTAQSTAQCQTLPQSHQRPHSRQYPHTQRLDPPQEMTLRQMLAQPANHLSFGSHLNKLNLSVEMWRTRTMVLFVIILIIVCFGLYLWYKQTKTNSKMSKKINAIHDELAITRKENRDGLTKINNSLLARHDVRRPPRLIGHLISASPAV